MHGAGLPRRIDQALAKRWLQAAAVRRDKPCSQDKRGVQGASGKRNNRCRVKREIADGAQSAIPGLRAGEVKYSTGLGLTGWIDRWLRVGVGISKGDQSKSRKDKSGGENSQGAKGPRQAKAQSACRVGPRKTGGLPLDQAQEE